MRGLFGVGNPYAPLKGELPLLRLFVSNRNCNFFNLPLTGLTISNNCRLNVPIFVEVSIES